MSELTGMYRELNDQRKDKRAENRIATAKLLEAKGVKFTSHNGGAHLILSTHLGWVDLWPGTGRWRIRSKNRKGFGVKNLIETLRSIER